MKARFLEPTPLSATRTLLVPSLCLPPLPLAKTGYRCALGAVEEGDFRRLGVIDKGGS